MEKLCGSILRSTAPLPSVYWQNAVTSCIGKLWQEVLKYSGYTCVACRIAVFILFANNASTNANINECVQCVTC